MKALAVVAVLAVTATMAIPFARAAECGSQAGGATCLSSLCCSQYGWCGSTPEYCGVGCQSGCGGGGGGGGTPVMPNPIPIPGGGVSSIVSRALFNQMLLHRSSQGCQTQGFYTYDAFIAAAADFPGFGTTGGAAARKRELAAFLAQTSHETTGGWPTAPNGPYSWGYCFINERGATSNYCTPSTQWPCAPGQSYYGRGPLQLSHNYNYGAAGRALGADLLGNPGLVATDPILSFKTAMWFWMTAQPPKPSSHEVIMGYWTPSAADQAAGRVPGFGVITNIVNGGKECDLGYDHRVADRIGFYKRYCLLFGVSPGNNLDCYHQKPFPSVFN